MNAREAGDHPWDRSPGRPTVLHFHVQPRASRTEVVGWHGDAIKIRVAAPPVDGAANAALLTFLADTLHVPRTSVNLVSGGTSRRKRIAITGRSVEATCRALGLA
jgi:uncharacterized protein (TIGR00251 family)